MNFPRIMLAFAVLLLACGLNTACGGGSSNGNNHPITPPPPPTGTNYTTCDSQVVPNWQSNLFIENYQPAIQAVVGHYSSNSSVGYMRIGLGRGGEIDLPQGWNDSSSGACYGGYIGKWNYTVGNDASYTWNSYLQSEVQYEGGLNANFPLLVSITPTNGVSPSTIVDDFIAPVAVANGLSFGNQGLEASDITSFDSGGPCGGDWCALFQSSRPQIRELQTLGQSCPASIANNCPNNLSSDTGPLPALLQFATGQTSPAVPVPANDLEIYYQDWLIAYDADYAGSLGVSSADQSAYQAAIQAAAAHAQLQVLFPPQASDTTACGSVTCFQAINSYLLNNPYVSGFVVDIDWSDFDIGNGNSSGNYNWLIPDATVSTWTGSGKTVNLVLQNTTYGGSGSCPSTGIGANGNEPSNCAMPAWMWTVLQ